MAAGQGMKGGSLANLDHSKDFRLYPKSSKKRLKGWEAGICQDNLFFFFFPFRSAVGTVDSGWEMGPKWI